MRGNSTVPCSLVDKSVVGLYTAAPSLFEVTIPREDSSSPHPSFATVTTIVLW